MKEQGKKIISYIMNNLEKNPKDISKLTAKKFGITRQAVNRYFRKLIKDGLIETTGKTRGHVYKFKEIVNEDCVFPLTPDIEEDRVWRQNIKHLINPLSQNIFDICHYGFTKMFNNAIDHSEGKSVLVKVLITAAYIKIVVMDNGIGIFKKITNELGLEDHRHAILELAKGKLTTDPERHTGEGIFFTSRIFDIFSIYSGELFFEHKAPKDDWLIETKEYNKLGTTVLMQISTHSKSTTKGIFDKYASEEDDYGFTKTHVPVSLLKHGQDKLISRSQAKRLLARFDRFNEVSLDFRGVKTIGRAFADEIFRVFRNQNPNIKIVSFGANKEVERAINRALGESQESKNKDVKN